MGPLNRYPGALWVPAHTDNYRPLDPKRQTFSLVLLHITSGHADPMGTARMFATPKTQRSPKVASSAHFVVGQRPEADEPVIQCVDLGDVALHAHAANAISVGVEHCAREEGEFGARDPGLPMTEAQYAKSARLVAWLCRLAGLPVDRAHIQGHAEADPKTTHTNCPTGVAGGWDWDRYLALVRRI